MSHQTFAWMVLACLALTMTEPLELTTGQLQAAGYDRPFGDPQQSRSVVIARQGMVATSHPLAAQVGLDVLKAGGNAGQTVYTRNGSFNLNDDGYIIDSNGQFLLGYPVDSDGAISDKTLAGSVLVRRNC